MKMTVLASGLEENRPWGPNKGIASGIQPNHQNPKPWICHFPQNLYLKNNNNNNYFENLERRKCYGTCVAKNEEFDSERPHLGLHLMCLMKFLFNLSSEY